MSGATEAGGPVSSAEVEALREEVERLRSLYNLPAHMPLTALIDYVHGYQVETDRSLCETNTYALKMQDRATATDSALSAAREVLRKVERLPFSGSCPICARVNDHTPDCALAASLLPPGETGQADVQPLVDETQTKADCTFDPRIPGLKHASGLAYFWHLRFLELQGKNSDPNIVTAYEMKAKGAKQVLDDIKVEICRVTSDRGGDHVR